MFSSGSGRLGPSLVRVRKKRGFRRRRVITPGRRGRRVLNYALFREAWKVAVLDSPVGKERKKGDSGRG